MEKVWAKLLAGQKKLNSIICYLLALAMFIPAVTYARIANPKNILFISANIKLYRIFARKPPDKLREASI